MAQQTPPKSNATSSQPEDTYVLRNTDMQRNMAKRGAAKQAAFLLPHLSPGMHLLDCGSGPGSITLDLARMVDPGTVVGIDIGASDVENARALAAERGVTNVRFEQADVYSLPFEDGTFDAIFSNAVFDYLTQPLDALREMYRVLKPGGVVGVRAYDADGYLMYPPNPLAAKFTEWIHREKDDQGISRTIGRQLHALFREVGFVRVEGSASYDVYSTPDSTRAIGNAVAATLMGTRRNDFIRRGWTDQSEVEQVATALRRWGEDPNAFFAQSFGEAIGFRP